MYMIIMFDRNKAQSSGGYKATDNRNSNSAFMIIRLKLTIISAWRGTLLYYLKDVVNCSRRSFLKVS